VKILQKVLGGGYFFDSHCNVSVTVTSQAKGFPLNHRRMVEPSGRLPSCRIKPTGSLRAWI